CPTPTLRRSRITRHPDSAVGKARLWQTPIPTIPQPSRRALALAESLGNGCRLELSNRIQVRPLFASKKAPRREPSPAAGAPTKRSGAGFGGPRVASRGLCAVL